MKKAIRIWPLVALLLALTLPFALMALAGCSSTLDAAATRQNLANVTGIVEDNFDLAAKGGIDATTAAVMKARNEAAVRLAQAMAADAAGVAK